jgi:hypothetical protein
MNMRLQLIRATVALAVIGGVATAETMSPPAQAVADADCPYTKVAKPQRILLLDPIQKHPMWIDARRDSSGDNEMHKTIDSREHTLRGVVAS